MVRKLYQDPPIKEVICDIRFSQNSLWDSTIPGLIFEKLQNTFPNKQQSSELETKIEPGQDGFQHEVRIKESLHLLKDDHTAIVQISQNRLIVNHLSPYTSWENYLKMIDLAFEAYKTVAKPSGIERIGLRYINEFNFHKDSSTIELKDYFDFFPHVSENLPPYTAFISGVQIPFGNDILRLELTNQGPIIILDLDYFSNSSENIEIDQIYSWLSKAHETINSTFENCIKDTLRSKFGEMKSK
jgi:uncharacterized protein (TIGR04255 family)